MKEETAIKIIDWTTYVALVAGSTTAVLSMYAPSAEPHLWIGAYAFAACVVINMMMAVYAFSPLRK